MMLPQRHDHAQLNFFLLLIFLSFNLSQCLKTPTTTSTAIRTRRAMPRLQHHSIQPLAYAQDRHNLLSTALALSKDDMDLMDEEQKLQMEIDSMMNPKQSPSPSSSNAALFGGGFDADAFDETKLPLPLFSSVVIFVVTTFLTGYMFYVGIMGFPENEVVPRIF